MLHCVYQFYVVIQWKLNPEEKCYHLEMYAPKILKKYTLWLLTYFLQGIG